MPSHFEKGIAMYARLVDRYGSCTGILMVFGVFVFAGLCLAAGATSGPFKVKPDDPPVPGLPGGISRDGRVLVSYKPAGNGKDYDVKFRLPYSKNWVGPIRCSYEDVNAMLGEPVHRGPANNYGFPTK